MPSLLSRKGASHAVPSGLDARRRTARRGRLALMAVPVLLVAGVVFAAPSLNPVTRSVPSPSSPAVGGPVVSPPPSSAPGSTPSPTPQSTAGPTATPSGPTSKPPEQLSGYVWPLRGARLTSRFGQRDDGGVIINGERYHDGVDLATWCGDKVRAAHAGTVLYAGRKFDDYSGYSGPLDSFYARMEQIGGLVRWLPIVVVVDDGNGYRSLYAHLSRASVEAGDVVEAGAVIGLEGATGRASGCHLHYTLIRMDGSWLDMEPGLVDSLRYPPFVRERVDPLLVLPRTHVDAPLRIQRRFRPPDDRLRYTIEPD